MELVELEEEAPLHLLDRLWEELNQEQGHEDHLRVGLLVVPLSLVPPLALPVVREDLHQVVLLEERLLVVRI